MESIDDMYRRRFVIVSVGISASTIGGCIDGVADADMDSPEAVVDSLLDGLDAGDEATIRSLLVNSEDVNYPDRYLSIWDDATVRPVGTETVDRGDRSAVLVVDVDIEHDSEEFSAMKRIELEEHDDEWLVAAADFIREETDEQLVIRCYPDLSEIDSTLESKKQERDQLLDSVDEMETRIEGYENELASLYELRSDLDVTIDEYSTEIDRLDEDREALLEIVDSIEADIQELEQSIDSPTTGFFEEFMIESEIDALEDELASIEPEIDDVEEEIASIEAELEDLLSEREDVVDEIDDVMSSLQTALSDRRSVESSIAELTSDITDLKAEKRRLLTDLTVEPP